MGKSFVWQTSSPESQGMSTDLLDALRDDLAKRGTKTFLVIRHDKIVYEWYAPEFGPKSHHYTASLAKALVGGVSLMVALNDGRIAVDDLACKYISAWKDHPQKSKITIRHLATHSSGLEDAEANDQPHGRLTGWIGSDNWPITWADDNDQYTAYGDGWGFEPRTEKKLSLGFAKIVGTPDYFNGVNVRSETGERVGDGAKGPKASGMLMVDSVLYMWLRNVDNSQLAWSDDRGKTWEWAFKFEESFGCPTFLNFGKNYEGSRDEYVYIYSQDGKSAYESYDQIVMARVPKDKVKERDAYQFFDQLDNSGNPVWTKDIHQRGAIFTYPDNCRRMDVVYNPGIKRYLLTLAFDHHGGWGIFDAPEPWGPWTTAFYTKDWGLGDTHGYRLPSKWFCADGKTMFLIFSGRTYDDVVYDAFCVRKLNMDIRKYYR